ncbi:XdhC family protein [Kiloniella sp. b19]|uniref:XdhC family protein n=1 Tax=Kiloniella sp. GXU_MW_B19 TaxID=3141326 RepID=UPI0031D14535
MSSATTTCFTDHLASLIRTVRGRGLAPLVVSTSVGLVGNSPRPVGSQIVSRSSDHTAGMISGGCVDPAIALDGLQLLETRESGSRLQTYGEGSHYIDLRLPCGSSILVLHDPVWPEEILLKILEASARRQAITLHYDHKSRQKRIEPAPESGQTDHFEAHWKNGEIAAENFLGYSKTLVPQTRLVLAGENNAISPYLELFARSHGFETLLSDRISAVSGLDRWTAYVTLLHDHEQEIPLLQKALGSPAFYIGALGSRKTHSNRIRLFKALGMNDQTIERIEGPIGLDIGASTPAEIATSIMGSIISCFRQPHLSRMTLQARRRENSPTTG